MKNVLKFISNCLDLGEFFRLMAASSSPPPKELSIEDGQIYLDYLAAVQAERQEILAIVYESELNELNKTQNQPLLTDSEILALFDSGYDVDMIMKAYPEFSSKKIKQLKRQWSDKQHKNKNKKKKKQKTIINNFDSTQTDEKSTQTEEKSNSNNRDNSDNTNSSSTPSNQTNLNSNNDVTTPSQTPSKRKRRRRAKSKNGSNSNTPKVGSNSKRHQCSWCMKFFGSEKALKQHFKDNPHMHEAV